MRKRTSDMVGESFGSLTVQSYCGMRVTAKCGCGSVRDYSAYDMRRGKITNCGCKPEALTARHPKAFRAWWNAVQRCHNPKNKSYPTYGGVGVTVAKEWRNNFASFFAYIGEPPSVGHSLDRFPDPFGNYEPGNVRWATLSEQQRNTRKNHEIWKAGFSAQQIRCMSVKKAGVRYRSKKKVMAL